MAQQVAFSDDNEQMQWRSVSGQRLIDLREKLATVLRARLGLDHANFFSKVVPSQDGISWRTALGGEVRPVGELDDADRERLERRAQQIRSDVAGLVAAFRDEGDAAGSVADLLDAMLESLATARLYSVGGRPVMVGWGMGQSVAPAAATSAAATTAAATSGGAEAAVSTTGLAGRSGLGWAFVVLGLALLLALGMWGYFRWLMPHPSADGTLDSKIENARRDAASTAAKLSQRKADLARMRCEPRPPDPIALLKKRIEAAGDDCDKLKGLSGDPVLSGREAPLAGLREQVAERIAKQCSPPPPPPQIARVDDDKRPPPKPIQKAACPGKRPKTEAPDFALVFDASQSMKFSVSASEQEIDRVLEWQAVRQAQSSMGMFGRLLGGSIAGRRPDIERLTAEPTRITLARKATEAVVRRLPSDVDIGLVALENCPRAQAIGRFPGGNRSALIGRIRSIRPSGGTALADGLLQAGRLVDGVKKDALIVLVSDGRESCKGDPCKVAAALKARKPRLRVNVVDITGTGAGNCIARITGGKVFTARNAGQVGRMTERAAVDAMAPAHCK
ncbi:MAG: VWA domain-containing protein [Burkholderiaceae bacterium]|nr:VWA domain-containing protein [Burkholderiaceae bacterium]